MITLQSFVFDPDSAINGLRMMTTSASISNYSFATLTVNRPSEFVYRVDMNRPEKRNAMSLQMWEFAVDIDSDPECRAVVLTGNGPLFTAGLDLTDAAGALMNPQSDAARSAYSLRALITRLQGSFTAIEKCGKPVIAAIHSKCIGAGVDMISACCIRYCTKDAEFIIKEVDIGLAADVGTLQRLPKIVGNDSVVRELAYTARPLLSFEAQQLGLVSKIFDDKKLLVEACLDLAKLIASKSPVAVHGTKVNLNYSRDHSVDESLQYMAVWNAAMLQTDDLKESIMSKAPKYAKL